MEKKHKINLHTHTIFCDGKNSPEEMVLAAIKQGFTVLGFSGHCFYPHEIELDWHISNAKLPEYTKTIRELAKKYENQITILHGFEVEYAKHLSVPEKTHLADFNPDYLIGSVHYVCNKGDTNFAVDESTDGVKAGLENIYKGDGKALVCDYFQLQREMLESGKFEVWGHPDLVRKRNGILNFFDENETWYKDELKATVKAAAKSGVIAEINTGAIGRKIMNDVYPSDYFLSLLYDAKVPVCVNSDTHSIETIDSGYDFAYAKAKNCGYKELIYPTATGHISIPL